MKKQKKNNLFFTHPDLVKEWHPTKNGDLKPDDFTCGSSKRVWWKCGKGDDHVWESVINNRKNGCGCPYCSGQKVSKTNNLAFLKPELVKQWHPKNNGDIKPSDLTLGSGKRVWWKCEKADDHEWQTIIPHRIEGNGCPYCSGKKVSKTNNLAFINPELAKEWHPTKNAELKSSDVTPASNKKVWWKCEKGDDHEWQSNIANRTYGYGCPYCSGQKVSRTNNLAFLIPELAKEWHPVKNGDLKPSDVTPGSNKKSWWKCEKGDDHEWESLINSRSNGVKCPYCSGKRVSKANNLAFINPQLAKEWHPVKNGDLKPSDVTLGSSKKVWWKCEKGDDHAWNTVVYSRVDGNGCPYCSGQKVSKTNNLVFVNPNLAKEWHPIKNGNLKPSDVMPGSTKKVWWKCEKGYNHEWESVVNNRNNGNGCPICNNKGYSYPEYAICYYLMNNNIKFEHHYKSEFGEIDVYLHEYNLAIEYNGKYYHENRRKEDEEKFLKMSQEYKLLLINEKGLIGFEYLNEMKLQHNIIQVYDNNSSKKNYDYIEEIFSVINIKSIIKCNKSEHINILLLMQDLETKRSIYHNKELMKEWNYERNKGLNSKFFSLGSNEIVWWKCEKGYDHEWQTSISHRNNGRGCPFCSGKKISKTNNLVFVRQILAKEWHVTKNGNLKPTDVVPGSSKKVWWKCEKGEDHEWQTSISHRNNGRGCPFCSGKKVSKTNNLAFVRPDLAKEWHETKNGKLKPSGFTTNSHKKVWWKCGKGDDHEWESTIAHRNNGRGCPVCSGQKVTQSNNLAFVNPGLAKEWHPTKNGILRPDNVVAGSGKEVWWKCSHCPYEWKKRIDSRTKAKKKSCPKCLKL